MAGERMKRKQAQTAKPTKRIKNIKKAFSTGQRAELGAVALIWNEIDNVVNMLLQEVLELPEVIWLDVVTRINGMDGKLEILNHMFQRSDVLRLEHQLYTNATAAVSEYKKYRDAAVHAMQFDTVNGIGQRIGSRAVFDQILLTRDALSQFYRRLVFLRDELENMWLVFRHHHEAKRATILSERPQDHRREFADLHTQRSLRYVPRWMARVRKAQSKRLGLGPLPLFPDELLRNPERAATRTRKRPEG